MSWEQHRYAVERARDRLNAAADSINDHCVNCQVKTVNFVRGRCGCKTGEPTYAGATLQGIAASDDANMLDEVADFLKSLEGSKAGAILENPGQAFIDDWNKMVATISLLCGQYDLPKPEMIFHPKWNTHMRRIAQSPISDTIIYAGIRIRFGRIEQVSAILPA